MVETALVTGAAGFIGSHLCDLLLEQDEHDAVVGIDAERTGSSHRNVEQARLDYRFTYLPADIGDAKDMARILGTYRVTHVYHLAAETHVDRSIDDPRPFFETNVLGTQVLLQAALEHGVERFLNVITDEVYGSTDRGESREEDVYRPTSPYAASKASQHHLGEAYHRTFDLPVIAVFPSNTYGPRQFPEKVIPRFVLRLEAGRPVPLMASTHHERDWLWVGDHCRGLVAAVRTGRPGRRYNLGAGQPRTNLDLTHRILALMERGEEWINLVDDRPGHDARYCVSTHRARAELDWEATTPFEDGLEETVRWYRHHGAWWWTAPPDDVTVDPDDMPEDSVDE